MPQIDRFLLGWAMPLQRYRWLMLGNGVTAGRMEAFGLPEKRRIRTSVDPADGTICEVLQIRCSWHLNSGLCQDTYKMSFAQRLLNCVIGAIAFTIGLGVIVPALKGQNSRRAFVERLRTVENSMTMEQVEQILGKPDGIWTRNDKVMLDRQVEVVWGYGSEADLQFPTLGRIEFNESGKVYRTVGKGGRPIAAEVIEEARLRELLQLIANGPDFLGRRFNPHELITTANAFQPLGQKKAFAVFQEFERVVGGESSSWGVRGQEVMHMLLLCLHDVPDSPGYLPQASLGAPVPAPPEDLRTCPRFPLHFIDDVPFLLVATYEGSGEHLPVTAHLEKYEHELAWIESPLRISTKPAKELSDALNSFRQSPHYYFNQERPAWFWHNLYAPGPWIMDMLETQLRRFVKSRDKQPTASEEGLSSTQEGIADPRQNDDESERRQDPESAKPESSW